MAQILVVDDDPLVRKTVETILRQAGHGVTVAADGYTAIDLANRQTFDLIVSDVNMPGQVTGYQLVSTLRRMERYFKVPIMLLTGRKKQQDVFKAISIGSDEYLIKPVDPTLLLVKVSALLNAKGPTSLASLEVTEEGTWTCPLRLISISETGVTLRSPTAITERVKLLFHSPLLESLGCSSTHLRVTGCLAISEDPLEFEIKAAFFGLGEETLSALRKYVLEGQTKKKMRAA